MEFQFGPMLKKVRDKTLVNFFEDEPKLKITSENNFFCQLTASIIFGQLIFLMIYVFLYLYLFFRSFLFAIKK